MAAVAVSVSMRVFATVWIRDEPNAISRYAETREHWKSPSGVHPGGNGHAAANGEVAVAFGHRGVQTGPSHVVSMK